MITKAVTADDRGVITLGPGAEFCVELVEGRPPAGALEAKPDGQDSGAFEVQEERALRVEPFAKMEIWGAVPGSKWFTLVAGTCEAIGPRPQTQRPVRLVYLRRTGPFDLLANDAYSLGGELEASATVWSNPVDMRAFSRMVWRVSHGTIGSIYGTPANVSVAMELVALDDTSEATQLGSKIYSLPLNKATDATLGFTFFSFGVGVSETASTYSLTKGWMPPYVSARLTALGDEGSDVHFYNHLTAELLAWR